MNLVSLFASSQAIRVKKGDMILSPSSTPKGVYFIEKGSVNVYAVTSEGQEKNFIIYKDHEIFPFFWTFDQKPIVRYYEAMTDCTLKCIPREEFMRLIQADPKLLNDVLHLVIAILSEYRSRIDTLEIMNSSSRFVSRIIALSERFGVHREDGIHIEVPITHKDIAASSAMTRETASRTFEKLCKVGILASHNGTIVICDMQRLQDEL